MQRVHTEVQICLPVQDVIQTVSVHQELLSVLFVKQELLLMRITLNVVSKLAMI